MRTNINEFILNSELYHRSDVISHVLHHLKNKELNENRKRDEGQEHTIVNNLEVTDKDVERFWNELLEWIDKTRKEIKLKSKLNNSQPP